METGKSKIYKVSQQGAAPGRAGAAVQVQRGPVGRVMVGGGGRGSDVVLSV